MWVSGRWFRSHYLCDTNLKGFYSACDHRPVYVMPQRLHCAGRITSRQQKKVLVCWQKYPCTFRLCQKPSYKFSRIKRLTDVSRLSPCGHVPLSAFTPAYWVQPLCVPLQNALRFFRFPNPTMAIVPPCGGSTRPFARVRPYWGFHVLLYEPDRLAPVTTPEEYERRTLSSRTTCLHLLTFVHSVWPRRACNRFRCCNVTMLFNGSHYIVHTIHSLPSAAFD